jgi:hypothetical protein
VAVEWVALGVAVGKVLLRAADQGPAADWVGDGHDLLSKVRGLRGHPDELGKKIASALQRELTPNLSSNDEQEVSAAAGEVTVLLSRLARSDEALLHAATHPDTFLHYAQKHGGNEARRRVGKVAELAFDRILEVACGQLVALAPWWPGFNRVALTEVLDQLAHLVHLAQQSVDNSAESARYSRRAVELLERGPDHDVVEASLAATQDQIRLGGLVRDWKADDLRVHDTITVGDATGLTPYIPRRHDTELRQAITNLTQPKMVTVVGTSCTGKTRACVEAVRTALPDWALVNPLDVADLTRLLRAGIPCRTVVWLDELQNFLTTAGGVEAARAIRRLLVDPRTPPMLFLGTIWPYYLTELAADPTAQEQMATGRSDISNLLAATESDRVHVPTAFTADQLEDAGDDPRVRAAIHHAVDGQVTQVLAGGTQLVDRAYGPLGPDGYKATERAVILAAADLRRVGHPDPLPRWAIIGAAPGYLDPEEVRWLDSPTWAEQSLDGLIGEARAQHSGQRNLHRTGVPPFRPSLKGYVELHDYLLQHHLRVHRHSPTTEQLWSTLTDPDNLAKLSTHASTIGENAILRGLRYEAGELLRAAADAGDKFAQYSFAQLLARRGDEEAVAELRERAAAGDGFAQSSLELLLAMARLQKWAEDRDRFAHSSLAVPLARRDAEATAQPGTRADSWFAQSLSAMLLARRGDEEAEAELRKRADAGDADWWLAILLMARPGDAEAELRTRADAGDDRAQQSLAMLLARRGDAEAAAELRKRADAGDEWAQEWLAMLLAGRGDEEAVAELQRLVHAIYRDAAKVLIELYQSRGGGDLDLDVNANARYHRPLNAAR